MRCVFKGLHSECNGRSMHFLIADSADLDEMPQQVVYTDFYQSMLGGINGLWVQVFMVLFQMIVRCGPRLLWLPLLNMW